MITMPKEFDAGTLRVKAQHKVNIPVVNNSGKKLSVKFTTSCGCSAPNPLSAELEPAQAINVEVAITKTSVMKNVYVKLFSTITHIDKVAMVNPPEGLKAQLLNNTKINFDVR